MSFEPTSRVSAATYNAAQTITNKFQETSARIDSKEGKEVKVNQAFKDAIFTPDITYKQLSDLTGKKYRLHKDSSKISFNEMTNIIKDPKIFNKFSHEQKITIIISYNNMKNQLKANADSSSNNTSVSNKMKKIFKQANPFKSDAAKAQDLVKEIIIRETPALIKILNKKFDETTDQITRASASLKELQKELDNNPDMNPDKLYRVGVSLDGYKKVSDNIINSLEHLQKIECENRVG